MWARARHGRVHDSITTAIGMLVFAFGRAPLDGEGALPVHWRKPAHMDSLRPPGTLSEGVERAVHRGNSGVIRWSFGGIRILWREFGRLDLVCDVAVHMKRAL